MTSLVILAVVVIAAIATFYYRRHMNRNKEDIDKRRRKKTKAAALRKRQAMREEARKIISEKAQVKRESIGEVLRRNLGALKQKKLEVAGQEVWYLEGGHPGQHRVLLLHGFAGHKEDWKDFAGQLVGNGYHVFAPDLSGFGQNEVYPDTAHDLKAKTKQVYAFAKALGLAPFHLMGASLGGSIAMLYACSAAKDVLSLTLLEPLGVRVPQESELDQFLAREMNPLTIVNAGAYDNLLSFIFLHPPKWPADLKTLRAETAAERRELYLKIWEEACTGESLRMVDTLVAQITQPTLVLQGANSRVVHPMTAELIARRGQNARAVTIEACGHSVAAEKASEASNHTVSFLKSLAEAA